jgi:hypothetical protein
MNNVSSCEEANNMQRSKLRRDSVLRCADEIPYIKAPRKIKGCGSQKDQR